MLFIVTLHFGETLYAIPYYRLHKRSLSRSDGRRTAILRRCLQDKTKTAKILPSVMCCDSIPLYDVNAPLQLSFPSPTPVIIQRIFPHSGDNPNKTDATNPQVGKQKMDTVKVQTKKLEDPKKATSIIRMQ